MQCDKIATFYDDTASLVAKYPICKDNDAWVAVQGDMSGESAENIATALSLGFSLGVWLALAIHAIGIEVYVSCQSRLRYQPFTNKSLASLDTCRV